MLRSVLCGVLCALAIVGSVRAEIIETAHFADITQHITPETLVILDVDDTLLITKQMMGCDEWFLHRKQQHVADGMSNADALERSLAEWEAIRHLTRMQVVEPGSVEVVRGLQKKGQPVMGLTTQGLALATRTVQQLAVEGIDLTVTAPSGKDHYVLVNDRGALMRKGILFTAGGSKGKALFSVCEQIGYQPKRIVFLNDKATHLADVEEEANKRGVEFVGLRYAYADIHKAAFSTAVADFQFSHSTFDHILSDAEAREMMAAKAPQAAQ